MLWYHNIVVLHTVAVALTCFPSPNGFRQGLLIITKIVGQCLFRSCAPHYTPEFACQQFMSLLIWPWVQPNLTGLHLSLVPIFVYSTSHSPVVRWHECGLCSKAYSSWKNIYNHISGFVLCEKTLGRVGLLIAKFISWIVSFAAGSVIFLCSMISSFFFCLDLLDVIVLFSK